MTRPCEFLTEHRPCLDAREDLSPERTWKKELHLPDASHKYRFELRDQDGAVLMTQTEGEYDWTSASEIKVGPQTAYAMPEEKNRTADDWLQFGKNAELNGELLIAVDSYQKALERFPSSFELQKAAGRLLASLQRFDEALHLFNFRARSRHHGQLRPPTISGFPTKVSLETARQSTLTVRRCVCRTIARRPPLRLAELRARQGQTEEAEDLLRTALAASDPLDLRTAEELTAVIRANKKIENADKLANELAPALSNQRFSK